MPCVRQMCSTQSVEVDVDVVLEGQPAVAARRAAPVDRVDVDAEREQVAQHRAVFLQVGHRVAADLAVGDQHRARRSCAWRSACSGTASSCPRGTPPPCRRWRSARPRPSSAAACAGRGRASGSGRRVRRAPGRRRTCGVAVICGFLVVRGCLGGRARLADGRRGRHGGAGRVRGAAQQRAARGAARSRWRCSSSTSLRVGTCDGLAPRFGDAPLLQVPVRRGAQHAALRLDELVGAMDLDQRVVGDREPAGRSGRARSSLAAASDCDARLGEALERQVPCLLQHGLVGGDLLVALQRRASAARAACGPGPTASRSAALRARAAGRRRARPSPARSTMPA